MSTHGSSDVHDQAALYGVGALSGDEAREFEAHLGGCESCRQELKEFSSITDDLASASAISPPPSLRQRVLEHVTGDKLAAGRLALEGEAIEFVRSAAIPWEHSRLPGIQFKMLYRDVDRACSTKLVRVAPGTVLPSHRHGGIEELFVLEGDALVSGVLMRAGDYCRAEPGTVHTEISTRGGVLFIGLSSDLDETLD